MPELVPMLPRSQRNMNESITANHEMGQPDDTDQSSAVVLYRLYSYHTLVTFMDHDSFVIISYCQPKKLFNCVTF